MGMLDDHTIIMFDCVKATHLDRHLGVFPPTAIYWLASVALLARSGRVGWEGGLSKVDVEMIAINEDDQAKMDICTFEPEFHSPMPHLAR
jgi:hypothetical protein